MDKKEKELDLEKTANQNAEAPETEETVKDTNADTKQESKEWAEKKYPCLDLFLPICQKN